MNNCQIVGLQRSGTNFCSNLITDNFDNSSVFNNDSENHIWKHSLTPTFKCNPDCIVYIYKHPLMWVESVINAGHIHYSLDKTIKTGLKIKDIYIDNLINMYNTSLSSWVLNYNLTIPKINIQYEKLLDDNIVENFLKDVEKNFNYKRSTSKAYIRELGITYMSGFAYPNNHLQKYKQLKCSFLTTNEQEYIINNISKDVVNLFT